MPRIATYTAAFALATLPFYAAPSAAVAKPTVEVAFVLDTTGDVIPGTGGIRKLRWRARGSGKRGGARVIYYFRDLNMPVFLLAVYAKGEKMNLTMHERELMQRVVATLVREQAARSIYRLTARGDPA
jgi:hypothetical protein